MDPRGWLALWTGKAVIVASRRLGRGGSTFPGRVVARIDPHLLRKLAAAHPKGNILITGTNGKTTTSRMLASILGQAGLRLSHNRAGANLIPGITTAFVEARGRRDMGLAEVDEATVPRAAREIAPRLFVVTNFFRDQLDRYGELQHSVDLVRRGLDEVRPRSRAGGAHAPGLVLNADDPLVAYLAGAGGREAIYYGVAPGAIREAPAGEQAADARHCPRCGQPLKYDVTFYAHLGHYRCPACGLARPKPQVVLAGAVPEGSDGWQVRITTPAGEVGAHIPVPGVYNLYNALAAAAAAYALGLPLAATGQGLETFAAGFGRLEDVMVRGRRLRLALVKNPTGFNQVLRTMLEDGDTARRLVIAINDRAADGKDISWLWDVDFEILTPRAAAFAAVTVSGLRAEEMALRLKYAGFPQDLVRVERDLSRALSQAADAAPEGAHLWVMPTYTALLEMRNILHRWGVAAPFWEV